MKAHLREPDTLVVEELALCRGEARIDLAVVNGELNGFEIKSAVDTLERLPRQAAIYGSIFDRVTLVLCEGHYKIAVATLPLWWGLILARPGTSIEFEVLRASSLNTEVSGLAVAQLLWREEALAVLDAKNLLQGLRGKPKNVLWRAIACGIPADEVRNEVRTRLKLREGWRADQSWLPRDEPYPGGARL